MKKLTSDEYRVRLMDLPSGVRALVAVDEEGFSNIYVNARLSREDQAAALRHELRHIRRDDAYNDRDIRIVER